MVPPVSLAAPVGARNALAAQWYYLPGRVLGDLQRRWPSRFGRFQPADRDDLLQVGHLGLLTACERWDAGRGVLFVTFAYRVIANRLLYETRPRRHQGLARSLTAAHEPAAAPRDPHRHDDLRVALAGLRVADRELLSARFGLGGGPGRTFKDLGRDLGLSAEGVRQRTRRAVTRVGKLLGALR